MTNPLSRAAELASRQAWARVVAVVFCAIALTSCAASPVARPASITELPTGGTPPAPALATAGSRVEIRAVRTVVRRALTTEVRVFDVDEQGDPVHSPSERSAMIEAVYGPVLRADLERALTTALSGPPFRRGGRFVVERWQGVQVRGDRAKAFVTGFHAYEPTAVSSQERDNSVQYQLLLIRDHGRWLVTRDRAALMDQG